MIFKSWKH